MKLPLGTLAVLFCVLFGSAAMAQIHIAPSALVAACKSDQEKERTKCATFLRGAEERLQAHLATAKVACREKPFSAADVTDFVSYAPSHMIPDSGEAFALALDFWLHAPGGVPCADTEHWSTGYLLSLCEADNSGPSLCKMYTSAALGIADVEQAVGGTRYFCAKGDQIRSDAEILVKFKSWVAEDPRRADQPAASGYIDMLKDAYPC